MLDITNTTTADVDQPRSQNMPSRRALAIVTGAARVVLHWGETWYFDDDVRDLIEPMDAADAGDAA